jgi:alkylation response protein AidB-like acyl-CoA dehydrogenase
LAALPGPPGVDDGCDQRNAVNDRRHSVVGELTSEVETRQLAAARSLLPLVREYAGEAERERKLPLVLVQAFKEAGLFRMCLPACIGGDDLDPMRALDVIEELATADGSVAWAVMVASQAALFLNFWEQDTVTATFTGDDIFAGTLGRMQAVPVDGGYRVSGQAAFASGSTHATWISGIFQVMDGDQPRAREDGSPEIRWMLIPASACTILDTWHTTGLRGTGSFDWQVRDVFVADALATEPFPIDRFPRWGGPSMKGPFVWPMRGALALGMARHAIDALCELAATRKPRPAQVLLRELPRAQDAVARAEAEVAAARLYLYDTVSRCYETLRAGLRLSERERASMPLATVHTVTACLHAIESMYRLGGGHTIYESNPIERCFRDINTLMADQSAAPWAMEAAGRVFLGLELPPGVF